MDFVVLIAGCGIIGFAGLCMVMDFMTADNCWSSVERINRPDLQEELLDSYHYTAMFY